MSVESILKAKYPAEVVDALLGAYKDIEGNYFLQKWKASELDAGHFVEAARRMLDHALFGSFTPLDKNLPNFHEAELKRYETGKGDDAFRILIPRILWSVYGIRNKRGVGHVGAVSPNQMDSTLILADVKWVLAELVRQASGLPPAETQKMVDEIIERRLDVLWKHGDITRVLDPTIPAREQVLLLLYDKSPQKVEELRTAVEYANPTNFKRIVKRLHVERLIDYNADTGICIITSRGVVRAETIARDRSVLK